MCVTCLMHVYMYFHIHKTWPTSKFYTTWINSTIFMKFPKRDRIYNFTQEHRYLYWSNCKYHHKIFMHRDILDTPLISNFIPSHLTEGWWTPFSFIVSVHTYKTTSTLVFIQEMNFIFVNIHIIWGYELRRLASTYCMKPPLNLHMLWLSLSSTIWN